MTFSAWFAVLCSGMLRLMHLLDLVIALLVLSAIAFGYERGFWLTVFEYIGLALGVTAAAALAPPLIDRLGISGGERLLSVLALLLLGMALGSAAGSAAGAPLRAGLRDIPLGRVADSVGGAVVTTLLTLGLVWYLGLSLSRGPSPNLARALQQSAILRRLDRLAPRPPPLLARLQQELASELLLPVFAGLEPSLPPAAPPSPGALDTAAVQAAAAATVKVEAVGCGGINLGSGFPVGPDRILTNAHVVSGTRSVAVLPPGARVPLPGHVVLFDPERDVAVILITGLNLSPLSTASAARGTPVAIIGYPGGGSEQVIPAVIDGAVTAQGRDIYGAHLVTRSIWVVAGNARPGNSGGPLVDAEGHVVGVIFASAVTQPDEAFALTHDEVAPDISASFARTAAIDTRGFACVS